MSRLTMVSKKNKDSALASKFILSEFSIDNFIVKVPSDESTYFEKCRTILPEIRRPPR